MIDEQKKQGLDTCVIICWILAIAGGIITGGLVFHKYLVGIPVAIIVCIITALILSWVLRKILCTKKMDVTTPLSNVKNMATSATTDAIMTTKKAASGTVSKTKAAVKKPVTKAKTVAKKATSKVKPVAAKVKTSVKSVASKVKTAPASKTSSVKKASSAKTGVKKSVKPKLFTKRPAKVDDLKLISGVGPKLEKGLNEAGIYQFTQIAVWNKSDIELIDSRLPIKARVESDAWVKQAKILAKGGNTEFSKRNKKS